MEWMRWATNIMERYSRVSFIIIKKQKYFFGLSKITEISREYKPYEFREIIFISKFTICAFAHFEGRYIHKAPCFNL